MLFLFSVVVVLLHSLACFGLGVWAWRLLYGTRDVVEPAGTVVLGASAFLLGVCIYTAMFTAAGLLGGLRTWPILFLLLPGWLALATDLGRRNWATFLIGCRQALSGWTRDSWWLSMLAGATLLLALGFGIAAWVRPPEGDAEAFYLVYSKVMAATGWLDAMPGPYRSFSTIGLPAELHFTALMVLANSGAAKLFVWPVALSAGVLLAAITRICGGGRVAMVLCWVIVITSTTFNAYIADGKVDLFAAAFGLAAIYWLVLDAPATRPSAGLFLSGLFAGSAAVAKFSYLPTLGVSLGVLFIWRHRALLTAVDRRKLKQLSGAILLMVIAGVVAWMPQLLKNGVLFGAPLAPFIDHSQESSWLNQVWFSPDVTRRILATYPLTLVFGRYPMQGGGLSLLWLALLPLVWLGVLHARGRSWGRLWAITAAGGGAVIAWMVLRPSVIAPRYLLASLLLFVPVVVIGTEIALQRFKGQGILSMGIWTAGLAALMAASWSLLPIPVALIGKLKHPHDVCVLASSFCAPMTAFSRQTSPGERIFVGGYYAYWLRPDELQCRDTQAEKTAALQQKDIAEWLGRRGFSYVVVDPASHRDLSMILREAAKRGMGLQIIHEAKPLEVYRVASVDVPDVVCSEVEPGRWLPQEKAQ